MDDVISSRDAQLGMDFLSDTPKVFKSVKGTTNTSADGVYGWYRYIQDFTGEFAEEWLTKLFPNGGSVWDPFAGSGTTLVASKKLGLPSAGFDVSPFMVDVVRAKTDWSIDPTLLTKAIDTVLSRAQVEAEPLSERLVTWSDYDDVMQASTDFPGDTKLRKWISPVVVRRLQILIDSIDAVVDERVRRFLRLGVAGVLVPASNMALRPNICYKTKATLDYPVLKEFSIRIRRMVSEYIKLDHGNNVPALIEVGDSRTARPEVPTGIFTSPPYPNDMEYVHQTRLELALLNYVNDKKGLTSLKKAMISSSVKLVYNDNAWQKDLGLEVSSVAKAYGDVNKTLEGKNWGWNPADMVAQYFGGMRAVMRTWHERLPVGGVAAVVIGDSAFNGIKVATDVLLGECAEMDGFKVEDIAVFRERWNTKHTETLRESVVVLRKGQH